MKDGEEFCALEDAWRPFEPSREAVEAAKREDESRCAVCGWSLPNPIKGTAGTLCRPGNCSQRPLPPRPFAPERAEREAREARELHECALRNGMPPSGRWA